MGGVLSLNRSGTLLIKVMQEYKIGLLAVQEVRWLGRRIIEKDCRIHYSCADEKQIFLKQALLLVNISDQE